MTKGRKGAGLTATHSGRPCHSSDLAKMNNTELVLKTFASELDAIKAARITDITKRTKSNDYE